MKQKNKGAVAAVTGVSLLLVVILYPMVPNHITRSDGGLQDPAAFPTRIEQPSITGQGIYSKAYQDQICSLGGRFFSENERTKRTGERLLLSISFENAKVNKRIS